MGEIKSQEQLIHEAAMKIMETTGVAIVNEKAVEILKANGIRVEDNVAYFTEEQVWHWVKKAPESFTIYARNPKYNVTVGGNHVNPVPTYGCAFIDDWEGNRRPGTMADYIQCLKMVEEEEVYDINGGILVQPSDIPEENSALAMFYAMLTHSEKAMLFPTGYKEEVSLILEACSEIFGGKEELIEKPRMVALINTVSPLKLDERMLDCLMQLAEYGQPVILCPASMLGATSPVFYAGSLASNTAEDLAGICLAQMIRPGTPVVFGIQSTAADMRGGITFACASPEGTVMQGFAANMAKFYGLPSRGGGCQTDAPRINVQAGYESMLTLFSSFYHGINLVLEAGGVMDSVNATCFEKMVIDYEIIREVKAALAPIEINDETLDLEEIMEVGHTGTYVTSDSTMENFGLLYSPVIGSRNAKDENYLKDSIDRVIANLLKKYEEHCPGIGEEEREKVKAVFAKSGMDISWLSQIEKM